MFIFEHEDAVRSILRRARVLKVDDSGSQQKLNLAGLKNEKPEEIVRILDHGFSSNPPAEGEGVTIHLGGRSDRMLFIGSEHKDKRPRNLPSGAVALYDADGKIIKLEKDKNTWDAGNKPVEITNATTIKIQGATDIAIGVEGRWIRIRPGRVDLGITSPTQDAPFKVVTTGGDSNVVWARID